MKKDEIHIDYYKDILTKIRPDFHRPTKVHKDKRRKSRKKEKQEYRKEWREAGYI